MQTEIHEIYNHNWIGKKWLINGWGSDYIEKWQYLVNYVISIKLGEKWDPRGTRLCHVKIKKHPRGMVGSLEVISCSVLSLSWIHR